MNNQTSVYYYAKAVLGIFILLIHCSCNEVLSDTSLGSPKINAHKNTTVQPNEISEDSGTALLSYPEFLEKIKLEKSSAKNLNQAKTILFEAINIELPKYWIGTTWDFNGVTRTPKEGAIACGYFVTNTLSDLGFEIQRTKLAQVVSSEMIKKLCVNIQRFSNIDQLKSFLQQQPDSGIYIVGLDFHTGYIIKDKDAIYFFHSNYIKRQGVVKELIEKSPALNSSKSFVVGSLSENNNILKAWMNN